MHIDHVMVTVLKYFRNRVRDVLKRLMATRCSSCFDNFRGQCIGEFELDLVDGGVHLA